MKPLISVIITNYNYQQFLAQSVESALAQTYLPLEVIVVDDGSTDRSLEIARCYSDRVTILEKRNGGQASAFNAGFRQSSGSWVLFLDADDWLEPNAMATVSREFNSNTAKIHFPLRQVVFNSRNDAVSSTVPKTPLSSGNVIAEIRAHGCYRWPPTSGNIFPRRVLQRIMPMPESSYRLCADLYLCMKAAEHGNILALDLPLANYRIHGNNNFAVFSLTPKSIRAKMQNLILAERLANDVTDSDSGSKVWELRDSVESGILARRFLPDIDPTSPSLQRLTIQYWQTREIRNLSRRKKLTAAINLAVLNFAPKWLVHLVIGQRIAKANRARTKEQRRCDKLRSTK